MAASVDPFNTPPNRGKHRTLAEIEAANARNAFKAIRNRPVQPSSTTISEWLSQAVRLGEDSMDSEEPTPPQPDRRILHFSRSLSNTVKRHKSRNHSRGRSSITGLAKQLRPSSTSSALPHRSNPSIGNKRKSSHLDDDDDDDCIIVEPPHSSKRRAPWPPEVVDLTGYSPENFDDDVIIIEPPAAEIRPRLRALVHGKDLTEPVVRPETRARLPPTPAARPTRGRRAQRNLQVAASASRRPEVRRPEAAIREVIIVDAAPALLQSVQKVCYFFKLPTELRDKIYRHLLVSPKPIEVHNGWTEPIRRPQTRRGRGAEALDSFIDARIIYASRQTAAEGLRILYSENTFLYLLRDEASKGGRRSHRLADNQRKINLTKYGHLLRHMAIELEPNRTDSWRETLMTEALEALAPKLSTRNPAPNGGIHLRNLTITVSPLWQTGEPNQARFLSVVSYFSKGATVLKALQRVDVDFLHIHVHINSHLKESDNDNHDDDEGSSSEDDDEQNEDDHDTHSAAQQRQSRPRHRHLETTIDLRFLPREHESLHGNGHPHHNHTRNNHNHSHSHPHRTNSHNNGEPLAHDPLTRSLHAARASRASAALSSLRRHMEEACLFPDMAMRGRNRDTSSGVVWEDHAVAERRRRVERERAERRFDVDAYEEEDEDENDDEEMEGGDGKGEKKDGKWEWKCARNGGKSLIISIDRVGDELRVYRP